MGSAAPRRPETILLVENDDALRELMRRVLEGTGFCVLAAKDGDDALSVARAHPAPIDLLLTDIVMPGLSGFSLASCIAEFRAETKVLYVSGYAGYEVIRDGLQGSGRPFLLKPFGQADLFGRIDEALHRDTADQVQGGGGALRNVEAGN